MISTIRVWTRSNNQGEWEFYGTFTPREWLNEQAHIRFLRSMSPLYIRTERSR